MRRYSIYDVTNNKLMSNIQCMKMRDAKKICEVMDGEFIPMPNIDCRPTIDCQRFFLYFTR